jgi:hypothetical protein
MDWVVNATNRPFYHGKKRRTHCIGCFLIIFLLSSYLYIRCLCTKFVFSVFKFLLSGFRSYSSLGVSGYTLLVLSNNWFRLLSCLHLGWIVLDGPQGRSGRVRKSLPTTGIRSPDRTTSSESLYRLSHSGPLQDVTYVTYNETEVWRNAVKHHVSDIRLKAETEIQLPFHSDCTEGWFISLF